MKIGILTVRHAPNVVSPVLPDVVRLLEEWRVEVTLIFPDEQLTPIDEIVDDQDLYVLKSASAITHSVAGVLHSRGATFLNAYLATVRCRDKVVATQILQQADVPVPDSFMVGHPAHLAPLLDHGPLVVKPHHGSQGRGVRVVWDADELDDVAAIDGPLVAQRYHEPDGRDRKLYCIAGQVFGVKRVWPARTYAEKLGEAFTVSPELRDIVLRCGHAFGLDLFGVDVITSGGRPYVIDVNPFPGFKGVPDAALRLADHIFAVADSRRSALVLSGVGR